MPRNIFVTVVTVLLLSFCVKGENDCENLEQGIKYFSEDLSKVFKVDKCCDFNGVRCDSDKNIREIKFNNVKKTNDISKFIESISKFKNLNYLDLANDNIEGNIPKALCSITTLKNLNLSKNKLKGTIPYDCKNLENIEQINLEGNKDLFGYVPIFPNVKGCAYKDTGLCDVPNALCKNAPKTCTEDDYKKTNKENGNPDSNSTTYDGSETRERDMSLYENYNGYSYGYSGYDAYNNYGNYDTSNYYGNTGYGYGYGDWNYYGGSYDNSYYNNGYYGTGYDNGYYYGTGYDTSYYDNGYYGGTSTTNNPSNTDGNSNYTTYSSAPHTLTGSIAIISVFSIILCLFLRNF
eukprot:jgi/Orpsp1_1/1182748/evm.model.c7180000082535.2